MNILIVDTETNGVDNQKDDIVEIACVLWNVEYKSIVEVYSGLLHASHNDAEYVNKIPHELIRTCGEDTIIWKMFDNMVEMCDMIVAHNAEFDREFIAEKHGRQIKPWVCSLEDIDWPNKGESSNLIQLALNHGVAVTHAHRALQDCMLLARMFEAVDDPSRLIMDGLESAESPKHIYRAHVGFDNKDAVKAEGFRWDPAKRIWWKKMSEKKATAAQFNFQVTIQK